MITRTVIASGHTQGVCLSGDPRKLVNLGHAPNRYQSNGTKIVANEIDLYQLRASFPSTRRDRTIVEMVGSRALMVRKTEAHFSVIHPSHDVSVQVP